MTALTLKMEENQIRCKHSFLVPKFSLSPAVPISTMDYLGIIAAKCLTYKDQVVAILQHHVNVQSPLIRVQALPLLLGEVHRHISECQQILKQKHCLTMSSKIECFPDYN